MSLGAAHGGLKTGVILSENTEWGKSVADKQKTFLEQARVEIKLVEHYRCARPHLDGRQGARAPARSGARQLVSRRRVADHSADGRVSLRPTVYAAGGGGHLQPDFVGGAGALAEGVICATAWDPAVGRKVPWIKEVNDRHVARNGVPITEDAACYYQCFQVLVDALERSKDLDPKKIRDAIAATDITDPNHKAMFVPCTRLSFDETGQNPTATAMVVQVQQGKLRLVHRRRGRARRDPDLALRPQGLNRRSDRRRGRVDE